MSRCTKPWWKINHHISRQRTFEYLFIIDVLMVYGHVSILLLCTSTHCGHPWPWPWLRMIDLAMKKSKSDTIHRIIADMNWAGSKYCGSACQLQMPCHPTGARPSASNMLTLVKSAWCQCPRKCVMLIDTESLWKWDISIQRCCITSKWNPIIELWETVLFL